MNLTTDQIIQICIGLITFFTALVALFGQKFWDWWNRPKIELTFNKNSDRCFRWAEVPLDEIQNEGRHLNVKRQYFRLKVTNNGGLAKK